MLSNCIRLQQAEVSLGRWYGPATVLNPACKVNMLRYTNIRSVRARPSNPHSPKSMVVPFLHLAVPEVVGSPCHHCPPAP